jgi:hypothetical protein
MEHTLDSAVERFKLLNESDMNKDRLDKLISSCRELPMQYLEAALKFYKRESDWLEKDVIPDFMMKENRRSVEFLDGTKISVKAELNASLSGIPLEPVADWLDARGLGGIVKRSYYLDQAEVNEDQIKDLEKQGIQVHADLSINTNSLKKTLKEHYEQTNELPDSEVMIVSFFNHAVIKKDKKDE